MHPINHAFICVSKEPLLGFCDLKPSHFKYKQVI